MSLITGTPLGVINGQEDLYVDGAPNVYYQLDTVNLLNNPDADQFYWGLSGTPTVPVVELGCIEAVALADNLTMNDVRCDNAGDKDTILRRNRLELTLTISTLFPLSTIRDILRGGPVTVSGHVEKMGLGVINNQRRFRVWMPKVYDEDTGDYVAFTLHKCKFVDAWNLGFRYGQAWQITNVKLYAYARTTLPTAQQFATVIRADPSAV